MLESGQAKAASGAKDLRWVWILLVLTHVGYAFVATGIDPFLRRDPLHGDAIHFQQIAESLASGGSFDLNLHRAPLFPLLMAAIYKLTGPEPLVIRALNGLLMTLGAMLMMPFVRKRFGESVAFWFLLAYALHPLMIHISGWVYTEPLMIALLSGLTWAYYEARLRNYPLGYVAGIGVLLGLIALTRSVGILYAVPLALWMVWDARGKKRWLLAPLALGLMALVIAPWTYRNWTRWHELVPVSSGGKHLWASNNDVTDGRVLEEDSDLPRGVLNGVEVDLEQQMKGMNPLQRDHFLGKVGKEWVLSHPGRFIALWPRKLYYSFAPISYSPKTSQTTQVPVWIHVVANGLFGLFFAFSAYGTWIAWRATWKDTLPLWLMGLILLMTVLIFNGSSRYFLPLAPAMCLGLACALARFRRELPYNELQVEQRSDL